MGVIGYSVTQLLLSSHFGKIIIRILLEAIAEYGFLVF